MTSTSARVTATSSILEVGLASVGAASGVFSQAWRGGVFDRATVVLSRSHSFYCAIIMLAEHTGC